MAILTVIAMTSCDAILDMLPIEIPGLTDQGNGEVEEGAEEEEPDEGEEAVKPLEGFDVQYALWNNREVSLSNDGKVSLMKTGGDCTFEVVYENTSNVTLDMTSGGSVGIMQGGEYKELSSALTSSDGEIEIIAAPGRGYVLTEISVNGAPLAASTNGKYILTLNDPSIKIKVTFEKIK